MFYNPARTAILAAFLTVLTCPAVAGTFTNGGLNFGIRTTTGLDACDVPHEGESFFSNDNTISFTCTQFGDGLNLVATGIGSSGLGVLHASATLNISTTPGTFQFATGVTVGGDDTLSFSVLPGHQASTATMFTRLHGSAACPSGWLCGGVFQVDVSNGQGLLGSGGVSADANSPVAQTASFSFPITGNMTLSESLQASLYAPFLAGQGASDYGSTASITGVQVFDAEGNDISEFTTVSFGQTTLTSGAPADESETPEPATFLVTIPVLAGILASRRRNRN